MIDASAELQERERTKSAGIAAAIDEALRERGVEPGTATLVAQVATVALEQAFRRWVQADGTTFTACLDEVVDTLRASLTDVVDRSRS